MFVATGAEEVLSVAVAVFGLWVSVLAAALPSLLVVSSRRWMSHAAALPAIELLRIAAALALDSVLPRSPSATG